MVKVWNWKVKPRKTKIVVEGLIYNLFKALTLTLTLVFKGFEDFNFNFMKGI